MDVGTIDPAERKPEVGIPCYPMKSWSFMIGLLLENDILLVFVVVGHAALFLDSSGRWLSARHTHC